VRLIGLINGKHIFKSYLVKLLTRSKKIKKIVDSPLNIKLGNLTPDELDKVLKNAKNKKAAGLANIS